MGFPSLLCPDSRHGSCWTEDLGKQDGGPRESWTPTPSFGW